MKKLTLIFSIGLLLVTAACTERVIEPNELPEQDPRLVLNSILYSGEYITANISLSKSILSGKPYKTIDNAVCHVYENGSFIGTLTSAGKGYYTSTLTPQTGKTYELKVTASGYEGVSASTTIPDTMSITNVQRYDTINYNIFLGTGSTGTVIAPEGLYGTLKYKFKIIDDPKIKNYYSIRPVVLLYDTGNVANIVPPENIYIYSNSNNNDVTNSNVGSGSTYEVDDQDVVNGSEITLDVTISFSQNIGYNFHLKNISMLLYAENLSPEYYKYLVTLKNQVYNGANFFAEPTQIYSNVSNKMGIVAGANAGTVVKIYP